MICNDCLHAGICINYTQGNCEDYLSEKLIRPKGEWKLDSLGAYCSECGTHPDYSSNYCPNCGADMRKKEKKNKNT